MTDNPIFDELYAARDKLLADAGGDAHKYLEGVQERERASGRLLSTEEQRKLRSTESAQPNELTAESLSSPPGDQ